MITSDEMNIVGSDIVHYLDGLVPESPSPAREMEQEAEERDFPIVGAQVGRLLMLFAKMIRPTRIVELGSGFGYSAFWFGQGSPKAEIHLTEFDPENIDRARRYLSRTDHPNRYEYHVGDALETVQDIRGPIDCVLNDLDKEFYPRVLDWAEQRLAPGNWLISDNVLWQGKVADSSVDDETTRAVREYNRRLFEPPWETSILPLRDGVAVSRLER